MVKKQNLPEPSWKEQLYAYGFTDTDIDSINEVPLHRFLIKMNLTFSEALKADIKEILKANNETFHDELIADVREVIEQELKPIKDDIISIKGKMHIMGDNYQTMSDKIDKLDKRTKEWKLLLLGILLFLATITVVWFLHKYIWSPYLISFLGL
jgi:hypothetical protein